MITVKTKSQVRHKILEEIYNHDGFGSKEKPTTKEISLSRIELGKRINNIDPNEIDKALVYLTSIREIQWDTEVTNGVKFYQLTDFGIKSYLDESHLINGKRWLFKKENIKFIYGLFTGVLSNEVIGSILLERKGLVLDMLTKIGIL